MFISNCKKITQLIKKNTVWKRVLVYGIVAFLVMQCYVLPFALENNDSDLNDIATIGDATWTNADLEKPEETTEELYTAQEQIENAVSDLYYQTPDMSNPFVAYAMTIPRGTGMNVPNMCA